MSSNPPAQSPTINEIVALRPEHDLVHGPETKVARSRGRPRKVVRAPDLSQHAYAVRASALRRNWIEGDDLFRLFSEEHAPESADVVQAVRVGIAREVAGLSFDLEHAAERGRDVAALSSRRIDGLLKLAGIELARAKSGIDVFDVRSPKARMAVQLLVQQLCDVAREVLPNDMAERVGVAFVARVEGWEDQADH